MTITAQLKLPLSTVTFIFGLLSIPLAFTRHLCSLAVVVGMLAMVFSVAGHFLYRKRTSAYTMKSERRMRWGGYLAIVGTGAGIVMWILYAENILLR